MKKILLPLICLTIGLLTPVQAGQAREMSVMIGTAYPPYYLLYENAPPGGLCVEIANEAAKLKNIKINYKILQWVKCLDWMKAGKADAIMPLFKTPEREEYLIFVDGNEVAEESNAFFVLRDSDIKYSGDVKELKGYLIGYLKNYSYGAQFDDAYYLKKEIARSEISLVNELVLKRLDIIVGSYLVVKYQAARIGAADKLVALKPHLNSEPLFITFSKKRKTQKLAEDFAVAMKQFKTTEKYKEILLKYGVE